MYLAQLAFCSDCREVTRQRFLSMFSHCSPWSTSLPKSPVLNRLNLFSSTHQTQIGAIHSWSIDPRGPGRRFAHKRRQHAPLPVLPMPGAGYCAQYHTAVSQNLDTERTGQGVRAQSLIYSQKRTHHCCRQHPKFNAYVMILQHTNPSIHSKSFC